MVPTLNGIDLRALTKLRGPFILINTGCLLRVTLQILTDWNPHAFSFVGISGILEVTALAWWGTGLIRIMRCGKRAILYRQTEHNYNRPAVIASNHKVAQILAWFPESETVFMRNGFSEINNPVLRRTVARQVSVAQAAGMHGIASDRLLMELNVVATNTPNRAQRAGCTGCEC